MSGIRLIVGLGNIGKAYEATRHNAGFWFVDRLADEAGERFAAESRFHGDVTRIHLRGQACWLLKPATLMNRSGQAVAALANFYKIEAGQILVAHDELDMMPGQARLKLGGGVAGHNGLKDIRAKLGTADFWRLRLGIGHPRELGLRQPVADYVLRPPPQGDADAIHDCIQAASRTAALWTQGDFDTAMHDLHTAVGKPQRPGI